MCFYRLSNWHRITHLSYGRRQWWSLSLGRNEAQAGRPERLRIARCPHKNGSVDAFGKRPLLAKHRHNCDEYIHAIVHYITLYNYSLLITIRAFPSEGRTMWVRRYCNIARVLMRNVNLTSHMTRQARFPIHNVIPQTGRAASLVRDNGWKALAPSTRNEHEQLQAI
jgi:hypothetical protein